MVSPPASIQYLNAILAKYAVPSGLDSPANRARVKLLPLIRDWADGYLLSANLSGSYAKGTATSLGTDADIFISLKSSTPGSLSDIYWNLSTRLSNDGYAPTPQDVSLGIYLDGLKIDLVPGRKQPGITTDHSLYRRKADTWTQTNVNTHIARVKASGRIREIRSLKIWRDLHGLDFPSFYLEMVTIKALAGRPLITNFPSKLQALFEYVAVNLDAITIVDPANTNNIVSNDLTLAEKRTIMSAASNAAAASDWGSVFGQ